MLSTEKPIVVLVPGAWHSPYHYAKIIALLGARGYLVVSDRFPTCGSKNPGSESVARDTEAVREGLVKPLVDNGHEVVMLMHSYGGCPGSAAVVGLSKEDVVAQGRKGGVIGLIFMCAFVAAEGDSMLSKLPDNKPPPWQVLTDDHQIIPKTPEEVFFGDVPATEAQLAIDMLKPQSYNFISTTSPAQAWPLPFYNGRRAYLKCTEDQAILQVAQDAMVKYSGVEWDVGELQASHSPHLSQPQAVVDFVVKEAEKFAAKP